MRFRDEQVIMTQLADISVILARQTVGDDIKVLRLWCDGTFGAYMWKVLHQIAQEYGGGAVGFANYFQK